MERLKPPLADAFLAFVLMAFAQAELWAGTGDRSRALASAASLLCTGALAWRNVRPLAVALIVGLAAIGPWIVDIASDERVAPLVALFVAIYTVAARRPLDRAAIAPALILPLGWLSIAVKAGKGTSDYLFAVAVLTAPFLAGRAVRARQLRAAELEHRTVRLEHERDEEARAAVAAERARIARELHDIVAHHISVIAVQAGTMRRRLQSQQEREAEELRSVESTARQALAEMRRLLGVLRTGDDQDALTPQPRLEQLERLVAQVREAGLPAELRVEGTRTALPSGLELTAYRIVQEALTNALKHAGPARAAVTVRYNESDLELEISDDGRGADLNGQGGGHGLIGMRERVALYGGSLETGPIDAGGFAVRARLPIGRDRL